MARWLLKSEPQVFGYADLQRVGTEAWTGVRNFQARNFLRQMREGDFCLIYHSSTVPPGVAGVASVVRAAYPDPTQFGAGQRESSSAEPRWSAVDVQAVAALPRYLPLGELRLLPELSGLRLLQKGSRLSVMPVTEAEFGLMLRLGGLDLQQENAL